MAAWNLPSRRETDREAMIEWARTAVCDPQVVFLDTETTGIGPDAEIVDIAVVATC